MTRKIDTLWDHLVELVLSCSDTPARAALVAHAFVAAGRARAVAAYRRSADGSWLRAACAGSLADLPSPEALSAHAEAEGEGVTWPAGIQMIAGLATGERWVIVADADRVERSRDEIEAVLVLLRVCRAGDDDDDHDDDPLELAGTALPADARHAADVDRERERAIHSSRRLIESVGARLRAWSEELDPTARAAQQAEIDGACADAIQRITSIWSRG